MKQQHIDWGWITDLSKQGWQWPGCLWINKKKEKAIGAQSKTLGGPGPHAMGGLQTHEPDKNYTLVT